jgi:hypothetical protein
MIVRSYMIIGSKDLIEIFCIVNYNIGLRDKRY